MTRRLHPDQQGQLQGANQSLTGIASIFGPIIFGELFAWSVRHDATLHTPGLAIYVSALLMAMAFLLALGFARHPSVVQPA
jgi:DHA1 family tetracycline resistance protein-like MFS transporter